MAAQCTSSPVDATPLWHFCLSQHTCALRGGLARISLTWYEYNSSWHTKAGGQTAGARTATKIRRWGRPPLPKTSQQKYKDATSFASAGSGSRSSVRLQARRSQHGSGWRLSVLRCHNKSNMSVRGTCSRAPRLDQGTAQLPVCWAASHGHCWRDHHRCYLRLHGALWRLGVCISNDQACVRGCCLPVACWAHPEPRQLGG